jgi:hypothetical protein
MFGDTFLNDTTRKIEEIEFETELKKNKKTIVTCSRRRHTQKRYRTRVGQHKMSNPGYGRRSG